MLTNLIIMVFNTISGLLCLYSFVAFVLVSISRMRLSEGIFRDFIDKLLIITGTSFIFTLWLLILRINGIENPTSMFFTNLLLMGLITSVLYTAFSINTIAKTFGFHRIADDVTHGIKELVGEAKPAKKKKKK